MKNLSFLLLLLWSCNADIKENTNVPYNYNTFETGLFEKINEHRNNINLKSVYLSNYISCFCLEHNSYMLNRGVVSHDYFEQRSDRIIKNLDCIAVGEVTCFNFSTPNSTINAILNSPLHKKVLENPKWDIVGVSNYEKYSTIIFAQLKNN